MANVVILYNVLYCHKPNSKLSFKKKFHVGLINVCPKSLTHDPTVQETVQKLLSLFVSLFCC